MTSARVKLNWKVPSDEWDAFLDYVHEKHGGINGHTGREVELAMREWIDTDDYQGIEERIDRLVRAAGRTPEDLSQKKSTFDSLESDDLSRVGSRIDPDLKAEFKSFTKEYTDDRLGIALARALRERRHGGRSARLEEKLDRVIDDAEGLLAELNGDEDGPEASLPLREKRTIAICDRLSDPERTEFTISDLHDAIAAVAGDSKPTIEEYEQKVIDRLDVALHPNSSKLYISREWAEEIAERNGSPGPDAPAIDRKDYADLSREEKISGLRIELARAARENGGRRQFDAEKVGRGVFDGQPSPSHVQDLMEAAAGGDGYGYVNYHGKQVLRVGLEYIDVSIEKVLDSDDTDETDDTDEIAAEASEEMGALMAGQQARTDGGSDVGGGSE